MKYDEVFNASYIFLKSKDHMGSNKNCVSPSNIVSLVLAVPLDRLLANPASSRPDLQSNSTREIEGRGLTIVLIG